MKKIIFFISVICLLPACKPSVTTQDFLGDYDAQTTLLISLSALPGVPLPFSDSTTFSIVELGENRVRLVYTDSTTLDATVNGQTITLDSDSTFYQFKGVEIKGIASGSAVLKDKVLTINGQFSGDVIGSIDMSPTPLTGTCDGTTVTIATKK